MENKLSTCCWNGIELEKRGVNLVKNSQVFKKDDPTFSWTDKEIEVLFESVQILKVNMEAKEVDWENLRAKCEKIMEIVHENYAKIGDIEEFPHGECIQELHKARIRNKIKKKLF